MAARPAEKWAARAFLALAHSRADIPPGIAQRYAAARGDMRQVAAIAGLLGHMHFPEIEPLLDELMGCVSFVVDREVLARNLSASASASALGELPLAVTGVRPLRDTGGEGDDIEEIATRQRLRAEVIDTHVGFSLPAAILHLIAVGSTMTEISEPTSSTTQTSRRRSR